MSVLRNMKQLPHLRWRRFCDSELQQPQPPHPVENIARTFLVQTFQQGFVHDLVLLEKGLQRSCSFIQVNRCQQHTAKNCPSIIRNNDTCQSAFTSGSMGGSLSLHYMPQNKHTKAKNSMLRFHVWLVKPMSRTEKGKKKKKDVTMGHGLWRDHTCDITLLCPTLGQFETSWGPNTKLQIQKILCHVTMRRSREVYSACCPRLFQFHGNDFLGCLFVKDLFLFSQLWLWSCPEKSTQKTNKVCKSYILETPMIIWEHKRQ